MTAKTTARLSAVGAGVLTLLMVAMLALAAALVVVPKIMGGVSLTVLTGSMEPDIHPGDVVVTRGVDEETARELHIGDVIVFLPYPDDPTVVTHRIVAKSVSSNSVAFITQGDNNNAPDYWGPVGTHQVRGEVMYVVPKVGLVRQWVGNHVGWVIPVVACLLLGYAVVSFATSFRTQRQENPT
ncbi:MAG: signal peptidase I [Propionibacteriaceae bacterium]|nr:signal peptidase I [Propionibacteriaceae bacterium]